MTQICLSVQRRFSYTGDRRWLRVGDFQAIRCVLRFEASLVCLVGTERAEKVGGIGYEGDGSAKQDCGGWDAGGRLALRLAF